MTCECPPPCIFHVWFRLACGYRRSPIGFFNRVIPTHVFAQSRNPDGYYLHPRSRAYFQSRISPPFCFNIPESWQISDPEKPIGESQYSRLSSPLYLVRRASERRLHSQAWFRERFSFKTVFFSIFLSLKNAWIPQIFLPNFRSPLLYPLFLLNQDCAKTTSVSGGAIRLRLNVFISCPGSSVISYFPPELCP